MQASLGIVSAWRAPHLGHVNSEVRRATTGSVLIYGQFCWSRAASIAFPARDCPRRHATGAERERAQAQRATVTPTTCGFSLIAVSVSAACARRIVSHIYEV